MISRSNAKKRGPSRTGQEKGGILKNVQSGSKLREMVCSSQKKNRVRINGKKVFINIQRFFKKTGQRRKKKISRNVEAQKAVQEMLTNKENFLTRNNDANGLQSKTKSKNNWINPNQEKAAQNSTKQSNVLVSQNNKNKRSLQNLRMSQDKQKQNRFQTSTDFPQKMNRISSKRKLPPK